MRDSRVKLYLEAGSARRCLFLSSPGFLPDWSPAPHAHAVVSPLRVDSTSPSKARVILALFQTRGDSKMGTLSIFSSSYCSASSHSCVLMDAWLALTLLVLSVVAVIAVLVCFRVVVLLRTSVGAGEGGEDADRSTIRRVLSGLHRRNRSRVGPPSSKVQSLPLAVIKKDATAANIHSHKNSRQHGADFLLQTRRMSITDMASGSSSHQLQRRAPRAEPAVLSVVKPLSEIVPHGETGDNAGRKRPRPPPLITTDENDAEGDMRTRESSSSFKLSLPSLRRTSRERSDQ